jgi:iron complex outermembrane receptor protein
MPIRARKITTTISLALAAAAAAQESVAQAQVAPASGIEEVSVTASRIVRDGYDSPTPQTVFNFADIEKSADPALLGALSTIPALSGSQTNGVSHGRQGESLGGMQSVNLRALGSNRVLVLMDGVRMSPASATNFVDVSTVPSQLISRVDVVTGGASAVYGSDAVAGVVNFVLDHNFSGLKLDVTGGQTNYDDAKNYKVSLTGGFGFADGRGHVLLSGEKLDNDGTEGTDGGRAWNRENWGTMANPAYTATNGLPQTLFVSKIASANTTGGGIITTAGPLRGTAFGPGGVPYQFNYGPISSASSTSMAGGGDWEANSTRFLDDLDPAQSSYNLFSRADFDLTDSINVFALASYGTSTVEGPFGSSLSRTNAFVTRDNAYLPASVRDQMVAANLQRFVIGSWNADMPKGPYENTREATRYMTGAQGTFVAFDTEWNWDATYAYGRADIALRNKSLIITRALQALDAVVDPATGKVVCRSTLAAPTDGCLPWNFMGIGVNDANLAAGAYEWMTAGGQFSDAKIEQTSQAASITGDPFSLPAGPVSVAFSVEHRTDKVGVVVDSFSAASLRTGSNYGPLSGEQSVSEFAAESIVPVIEKLDLSLAARATDYEYSGEVTTWKVGSTYSPIDSLTFRVTRSRDIRAPNIRDLFASPNGFGGGAVDRSKGNAPVVGAFFTVQGNPDLKPEEADTTGIGVVMSPSFLPGFTASVDYWRVNIKDAIVELQAQDVVDACYYGIDASACPRIERGADGNIAFIRSAPLNLAKHDASGVDVEFSYRMDMADLVSSLPGSISLRSLATFYLESVMSSPFTPTIDIAGSNIFGSSGAAVNSLPDWKLALTAAYELDRLSVSLAARGFADGKFNNTNGIYTVCESGCPVVTAGHPTINYNALPGRFYVDANLSYELDVGDRATTLSFSVKNAFDKDPPPLPAGANLATLYDVMGRVYRAGVRVTF